MNIFFPDGPTLTKQADKFCQLYRSCFTAHIDSQEVVRRFLRNPLGDSILCVAEENGEYAAHCAASPVRVRIGDEFYKAAIVINVMTNPKYRGRGLISGLINRLGDRLTEEGYALAYVYPNPLSVGIFSTKAEWQVVREVPTSYCAVEPSPIPPCSEDDGQWDKLVYRVPGSICVSKPAEYIAWRYEKKPGGYHTVVLSPREWAIYKIYNTDVNVVEFIHNDNPAAAKELLTRLKSIAAYHGCTKLSAFGNATDPIPFETFGFVEGAPVRSFSVKSLTYSGDVDVYNADNWHVSMGDDNVY